MALLSFTLVHIGWRRAVFVGAFSMIFFAAGARSSPSAERPSRPTDNNPPSHLSIVCPADLTVGTAGNGCLATVQLPVPQVLSTNCPSAPTFVAYSPWGTGIGPFAGIETGTYSVQCLAFDACGDSATCVFRVVVADLKKPAVALKHSVFGNIGANGIVRFTARQLNQASSDNCTAAAALRFAFSDNPSDSTRTFGCNNLGEHLLSVTVFDETGNRARATARISVLDGMNFCQHATLAGLIETPDGKPVANVRLTAEQPFSSAQEALTEADGRFRFDALLAGQPCSLAPFKNDNPLNGISAYDLKLLHKHIIGEQPLDSPYKLIAADVNANGKITLSDLLELRSLMLGDAQNFSNNTSWRFVEKGHSFMPASDPLATGFPEKKQYGALPTGASEAGFWAVKIGDLNGDAVPHLGEPAPSDRGEQPEIIILNIENQHFRKGDTFTASIFLPAIAAEIDALQFTLDFDMNKLSLRAAEASPSSGTGFETVGLAQASEGSLTLAWTGQSAQKFAPTLIMQATFTAIADGQLCDALRISDHAPLSARAFDKQGKAYEIQMKNPMSTASNDEFRVFPNYPNPFFEMTLLRFALPEAGDVSVRIFNDAGQLVFEKLGTFPTGESRFVLDRSDLHNKAGLYLCEYTSKHGSFTRKLMMF